MNIGFVCAHHSVVPRGLRELFGSEHLSWAKLKIFRGVINRKHASEVRFEIQFGGETEWNFILVTSRSVFVKSPHRRVFVLEKATSSRLASASAGRKFWAYKTFDRPINLLLVFYHVKYQQNEWKSSKIKFQLLQTFKLFLRC